MAIDPTMGGEGGLGKGLRRVWDSKNKTWKKDNRIFTKEEYGNFIQRGVETGVQEITEELESVFDTLGKIKDDKNFKDEDFNNKIKNEDISVVQFSAAWCGPCKVLKPVMDKLADQYKDKAGFYYADIEDGGINTGSAAGIRGVPTVIVYKKGVEVDRKVGGVPESNMKEFLEKNI